MCGFLVEKGKLKIILNKNITKVLQKIKPIIYKINQNKKKLQKCNENVINVTKKYKRNLP